MAITGTLVLLFILVHVGTFKFDIGGLKGQTAGMEESLYAHVVTWFSNPLYSAFYLLALAGLGLHLSHGVQSAFQTFGLNHPRYTPLIRKAGIAFGVASALAFASFPIYFGFIKNCMSCATGAH